MEGYGYPYPTVYAPQTAAGDYPDHGDGFGEYYGIGPVNEDNNKRSFFCGRWQSVDYSIGPCGDPRYWPVYEWLMPWAGPMLSNTPYGPSCSKYRGRKRTRSHSRDSATKTRSKSRTRSLSKSRSRSRSRSRSKSRSKSRSRSRTATRSRSRSQHRDLNFKEPGILDAFRVMYLTPSKHKKSTTKYLLTKKRQDRIQEALKVDGLGSKRWFFYPRSRRLSEPVTGEVPGTRDNCDQRVKVDGDFFRKYKRSKKVDKNAPIMKLKRWELILYEKLGFIQSV